MAEIKYIIPFTYKWEGGLSNATTDNASKNPANISPYTINGKKGWHTNKGVTYSVFKSGASKYGYQDTLENFKDMPHEIWLKIAKGGYWDTLNLDNLKSQAVANVMFSWCWGSGYAWIPRLSSYLKSKGINWVGGNWVASKMKLAPDFKQITDKLNQLIDKQGEKQTFEDLIEQKKQFLLSLGEKANPKTAKFPQGINTKGWMNRLTELQSYSSTLLGKGIEATKDVANKTIEEVKKKPLTTIVLTTLLLISSYLVYNYTIKNKIK